MSLPKLYLDAKISFDELTFDFMESLNLLEPFGNENPAPIFYCDAKQIWPPKVVGKSHLKLYLEQDDRMLEGIAFGMADQEKAYQKKSNAASRLYSSYQHLPEQIEHSAASPRFPTHRLIESVCDLD